MSIKVTRKGDKISVETDYYDSYGLSHSDIYVDRSIATAMKLLDIDKVEVYVGENGSPNYALKNEIDRIYKEKTGDNIGWFYP